MGYQINEPIEKLVGALSQFFSFKESTSVGDILLILSETRPETTLAEYALVREFVRDETKRDPWWHVHMTRLNFPASPAIVTLQESHFTGQEIFTINKLKVFIKALDFAEKPAPDSAPEPPKPNFTLVR
ncbi:MAG: hypothetical protein LBO66_03280 [Deltaproteobacteria bacterium]|nr:hypothetical protein [Deltaproteobacteria bacterium]